MLCVLIVVCVVIFFFFFNDTATTEIYTLSLHDALPICARSVRAHRRRPPGRRRSPRRPRRLRRACPAAPTAGPAGRRRAGRPDRKSTRLNSSHANISYAVFCLKKKKKKYTTKKNKNYNT